MTNTGGPEKQGYADDSPTAATARRRVRFHSEALGEPFEDVRADGLTIDVDTVVRLDDGTYLQYWTVTHTDPERFVAAAERLPTTLEAALLSTVEDTHRFEIHGAEESLFGALEAFDGVTRSATYDADGVDVVAEFPVDTETDAVVEAVQSVYPSLELLEEYTVETVSDFRQQVRGRLTQRQQTVLQLSYFGGYYERPRRRTGEELAGRLGISRQAFHDHLRRAHATVFEALVDDGAAFAQVDR